MMIISDGFSRSRSRKSRSRSRYDSMVTASKSKQEKALHCPYHLKHSQPYSFLNNAQIRLINLYLKLESGNFFSMCRFLLFLEKSCEIVRVKIRSADVAHSEFGQNIRWGLNNDCCVIIQWFLWLIAHNTHDTHNTEYSIMRQPSKYILRLRILPYKVNDLQTKKAKKNHGLMLNNRHHHREVLSSRNP